VLVVLVATAAVSAARAGGPTTVVLVRHAEKASDGTPDPGLTDDGRRRAASLAHVLADAGVTHLFATEFRRTQETLAPLGERAGRDVTVLRAGDTEAWLRALRGLPAGSVAVVAGHSNTIPGLACALAGEIAGLSCKSADLALPDAAYDRLFVVLLPAEPSEKPRALALRFGS
jgi:broad specificity phosphatase PhoE